MESSSNDWASLIMKYLHKNISPEEMSRLEKEMEHSPIKRAQFERFADSNKFIEEIWSDNQVDTGELLDRITTIRQERKVVKLRTSLNDYALLIAAVICLACFSVPLYFYFNKPEKQFVSLIPPNGRIINLDATPKLVSMKYNITKSDTMLIVDPSDKNFLAGAPTHFELVTPPGKKYIIQFSDGTIATLNEGSSVKFPMAFSKQARDISFTGEIYLAVATNDQAPFVARVNNAVIEATGTSFSVNAYNEKSIKTTLFSGKIKVVKGKNSISLKPGEQVLIEEKNFRAVHNPNLGSGWEWARNYFDFNDMSIREMMRQIERHYKVKIIVDESVSEQKGGGKVSMLLPLAEVLKTLEECCEIAVSPGKDENSFIVTGTNQKPNP